jgi:enterochelin esterase-like enzyme
MKRAGNVLLSLLVSTLVISAQFNWVDPQKAEKPLTRYRTFHSKTIDGEVSYLIYLPPDYEQPGKRYPVLYWLHGTNGAPVSAADIPQRMDPAIRAGRAPAMIIVLVNGLLGETMYCDSRDGRWPLETVIVKDLIPHIDSTYRTVATRERRGIEGFSMGGFGAAHLGFKYPEVFGAVSIMAPALLGPELKQSTPANAWARLFKVAMGEDLDYWQRNNPFTLVKQNRGALRGRTAIRVVGHLEPQNWQAHRCRELHALMDQLGIPHQLDVREDVKTHNKALVLDSMGDSYFEFWRKAFGDQRF